MTHNFILGHLPCSILVDDCEYQLLSDQVVLDDFCQIHFLQLHKSGIYRIKHGKNGYGFCQTVEAGWFIEVHRKEEVVRQDLEAVHEWLWTTGPQLLGRQGHTAQHNLLQPRYTEMRVVLHDEVRNKYSGKDELPAGIRWLHLVQEQLTQYVI